MSDELGDEPGALTKAEFAALITHLEKFTNKCSVCGGDNWDVPGVKEHGSYAIGKMRRLSGTLMVPIVCRVCFCVRQFAWFGIERIAAS